MGRHPRHENSLDIPCHSLQRSLSAKTRKTLTWIVQVHIIQPPIVSLRITNRRQIELSSSNSSEHEHPATMCLLSANVSPNFSFSSDVRIIDAAAPARRPPPTAWPTLSRAQIDSMSESAALLPSNAPVFYPTQVQAVVEDLVAANKDDV